VFTAKCVMPAGKPKKSASRKLKTKNSLRSIIPRDKSDLSTFIYVLRRVRHESLERMSSQEAAVVDEHFEYLKEVLAEGKLTLAG